MLCILYSLDPYILYTYSFEAYPRENMGKALPVPSTPSSQSLCAAAYKSSIMDYQTNGFAHR